jgi:hypothetical protein
MRMGEEKSVQEFGGKAQRKETTQKIGGWDQNGSYRDWLGRGVNWIRLAQDRDRRRAVVNAVMNLHVLAPRS